MKITNKITFVFMFIATSYVCLSQNGNLYGKVSDNNSREELGGTKITVSNKQVFYSDVDGNFSLQNIPAGKYTLVFSSLGYTDYTKEIEIREEESLFLNTLLSENELESIAVLTTKK